jgi:hypothetical protein
MSKQTAKNTTTTQTAKGLTGAAYDNAVQDNPAALSPEMQQAFAAFLTAYKGTPDTLAADLETVARQRAASAQQERRQAVLVDLQKEAVGLASVKAYFAEYGEKADLYGHWYKTEDGALVFGTLTPEEMKERGKNAKTGTPKADKPKAEDAWTALGVDSLTEDQRAAYLAGDDREDKEAYTFKHERVYTATKDGKSETGTLKELADKLPDVKKGKADPVLVRMHAAGYAVYRNK